jgi:hypothetical protein
MMNSAFGNILKHLIAAISIAFCIPVSPAQAPPSKFTVKGHILFSDGQPAPLIDVSLSIDAQNWNIGPAITDATGAFQIDNVPAGEDCLLTDSLTQGSRLWGRSPMSVGDQFLLANTVTVGPAKPIGDVVVQIDRAATVFGKVTDVTGDPVTNSGVVALRRAWAFGRPYFIQAWSGISNDEGDFRMPRLPKGRYRVCASFVGPRPPTGTADFSSPDRHLDVTDCPSSGPILDISPGQELRVDLKTRLALGVPVSVRISGSPPDKMPSIEFQRKSALTETRDQFSQPGPRTTTIRRETIYVDAVLPGRYLLQAATWGDAVGGRMDVVVTPQGPNTVNLRVGAHPVVNLDVSGPPGFDPKKISIGLHDADAPGSAVIDSNSARLYNTGPDPSRITLRFPGRYWLVVRSELCLIRAQAGAINLLMQPLPLTAGETTTAHLKFDTHCATIRGGVKSAAKTVPDARVAILISGTPQDPGDVLVASAGDNGEFSFTGMTPGVYWLWAWTEEDELSGRVDSLAVNVSQGRFVRVSADQTQTVDLTPLRMPPARTTPARPTPRPAK